MLHLDARIHLEEEELLARGVDQEFHRAGAAIFESRREAHRGFVQARAQLRGQSGRRRLLDDLLVAALHGAVALAEMHHVAGAVAQHLHFHVPRRHDATLQVHARIAECRARLGRGELQRGVEILRQRSTSFMPRPPPPPTALTSSGRPMRCASSRADSRDGTAPPGATGTPAASCATRARRQLVAGGVELLAASGR